MVSRCCSARRCGAWARGAFGAGVRSWQDYALMRSQALDDGKMPAKCVPGRQSVASFALHASRKRPRAGKSPVRGKIRAPCIRNELALAESARHASEMPRKPPLEDTPREDLARKGHFSLHGPLESCTARESCHPASTKHPSARNPCAADQRQTALAPAIPAPPSWQRATHSIRGARGSHTANAPTPHRPATLRRQADVKSCAARAPQRQSATRGQPRRKRSHTPHQRQRPALQWRASARCRSKAQRGSLAANPGGRPPLAAPAAPNRPRTPRANQQQPSAGLRFAPSKARTHHTYLSAAPVAGFSS